MTEPEVGTDVLAMGTKARREGEHYVLDGRKTFITNGGIDETTLGDAFVVKHSAADVAYCVDGFLQKNKDRLNENVERLMQRSELPSLMVSTASIG